MSSTNIQFNFNAEKTVQVAAMFLKLHRGRMKYLGLLKLLYMADRLALKEINQPLTGDVYVSMKYGPVLSKVYDFIKDNKINGLEIWKKYISNKNHFYLIEDIESYEVSLLADPGNGELSEREEEIIRKVYKDCGSFDRFDLADMTHDFPEWQAPPPGRTLPINNIDILRNIGKTEEEIEYIKEVVEREAYFNRTANQ